MDEPQPIVEIKPLPGKTESADVEKLAEALIPETPKIPKGQLKQKGRKKYYISKVEDFSAQVETYLNNFEKRIMDKFDEYAIALHPKPEVNTPAQKRSFLEHTDASISPHHAPLHFLPKTEFSLSDSEAYRAISTPYRTILENEQLPLAAPSILSQPMIRPAAKGKGKGRR